jgi:hypothetical protein
MHGQKNLAFDYEISSFVLLVGIFLRVAFHLLLTVSLRSEMQAENIFKEQKGKERKRERGNIAAAFTFESHEDSKRRRAGEGIEGKRTRRT